MNVLGIGKKIVKAFVPYGMLYLYRKLFLYGKEEEPEARKLFQIEVHITEHCNLNCKSCWHFSCIAEKEFLSLNTFENDMKRLSGIVDKLSVLKLLGGEPLLHPQIIDFIRIARIYFPNTFLQITTNGILLGKQDANFWTTCRDNNVIISISTYPINLDIDHIEKTARKYNVYLIYNEDRGRIYSEANNRQMYKWWLDIHGRQKGAKNYAACGFKNGGCVTLRDGKIFTCFIAAHIKFFNKKFNKNLAITENDYIDIYKTNNVNEIYKFLFNPIPFCRYCIPSKISFSKWETTKGEITDWV